MPLEDLTQIDLISKGSDGTINLIITDAGLTTDPDQRTGLLRQKIALYTAAVTEGRLAQDYPDATAQDYIIRVVCTRRPSGQMFALAEASPAADPSLRIPVIFDEFPAGAWNSEQPSEGNGIEPPWPGEAAAGAGEAEAVGEDLLAALAPLANLAFELAGRFLQDGQVPFFVLYPEGDQTRLSPIEGCESAEDIWPWLRRWADSVPHSVEAGVFVCQAFLEEEAGEEPVLLAHCFLRQETQGYVLRRALESRGQDSALAPTGDICFHGRCEGVFFRPRRAGEA